MRMWRTWVASLALPWAVAVAVAGDSAPARLATTSASPNQTMANELAQAVKASGKFKGYAIDIETDGGVVTLAGNVSESAQRAELVNLVRRHAGVVAVQDRIAVAKPVVVTPVLFAQEGAMSAPAAPMASPTPSVEPMPMHAFPAGLTPYADAPVLPPYSWPAYTPYNNYASMAYQTQYPSGAWPFIGPPHPYPMIPSGWRRVSLKWRQGYWWLKFHAH